MIDFSPLSPVFLQLGPLKFHYYGLMYAIGFLISYLFLKKKLVKEDSKIKITEDEFDKFFFGTTIFALLGGRLGHILIYNFEYFSQNPMEIIKIWKGGMASHGGFLGAALGFTLFKPKKIAFWKLADLSILMVPIGLAFGRIGNLINGELYGRATDLPWCMKFADEICRHPTQIYAFIKNIIVFSILYYLFRKKVDDGIIFATFLIIYGILRIIVESFKEKTLGNNYLDLLTTGQLLSVIMILIGVGILAYTLRKNRK